MKKKIRNGVYLVIDPAQERQVLLSKLKEIIQAGLAAVQVWDNFKQDENPIGFLNEVIGICHSGDIPVLINNRIELLNHTALDGVHFDLIPENIQYLKNKVGREVIYGITCTNDLSIVKWANDNGMDYISFCSMFSSRTANSCELVSFNSVKTSRQLTDLPIFLAGGIDPEKVKVLSDLSFSGIAVVSGIMNSSFPAEALNKYQQELKLYQNETRDY